MFKDIIKKTYLHVLVIAVVGLVAYSNSFNVPFQFDDLGTIRDNPYIKNLENFNFLKGHQYNPREEYNPRRYLGYVSLALNYRWGGLEVTGYHIVNLLIHLINGTLVYFFVMLTFRTPYFKGLGAGGWGLAKSGPVAGRHESRGTIHDFQSPIPNLQSPIPAFIALFSALLFVAHPVQTQAVTYIVQRFTSLATLFYLLAVVMYVKGRLSTVKSRQYAVSSIHTERDNKQSSAYCLLPTAYYFFSLLSAVCAMKVKEIAFTLPIMIFLYEFTFFRSTLKQKLLLLIPILLTLMIVPISVLQIDRPLGEVLSDLSERSRLQTDMPRGDYLMTEFRVIVTYIRLIFMPVDQNLDYDYPIYRSFFSPPVLLSFLFLATLFGIALYLLYKSRWETAVSSEKSVVSSEQTEAEGMGPGDEPPVATYYPLLTIYCFRLVAFGILWSFIALSVESSFIPIVDVIFEHRLYLPSIGAFIALSVAFFAAAMKIKNRWPGAEKAVIPLALIIVLVFSATTYARNRIWQDETRLWEDVVRKSPGNARTHNNLGFLYNAKGMNAEAIEQFLSALRLRPDYLDARINLGIAYNAGGMYDHAIEHFLIALSMDPEDADAHNNLGIAYVSKGLFDEAIKHYQVALRLWPDYAEAHNNLGVAYGSKGMSAQAIGYFEQAIRLKADYFEANYNLALLFDKMGDHEKALVQYNKTAGMKPADALP